MLDIVKYSEVRQYLHPLVQGAIDLKFENKEIKFVLGQPQLVRGVLNLSFGKTISQCYRNYKETYIEYPDMVIEND